MSHRHVPTPAWQGLVASVTRAACLALAAIWMFVSDKDALLVLNSLVLVYIVFALAKRLMKSSNKK